VRPKHAPGRACRVRNVRCRPQSTYLGTLSVGVSCTRPPRPSKGVSYLREYPPVLWDTRVRPPHPPGRACTKRCARLPDFLIYDFACGAFRVALGKLGCRRTSTSPVSTSPVTRANVGTTRPMSRATASCWRGRGQTRKRGRAGTHRTGVRVQVRGGMTRRRAWTMALLLTFPGMRLLARTFRGPRQTRRGTTTATLMTHRWALRVSRIVLSALFSWECFLYDRYRTLSFQCHGRSHATAVTAPHAKYQPSSRRGDRSEKKDKHVRPRGGVWHATMQKSVAMGDGGGDECVAAKRREQP